MAMFVHMSDTHLGSRIYMSDTREGDFYDAFEEAVQVALDEKVDFIVHSGDLFDSWSPSNFALSRFRDAAIKLRDANIPVFLIMGDHDRPKRSDFPAPEIFDFLGIRLLGKEGLEWDTFNSGSGEVLIAGISNMKGMRRNQLLEEYRKADEIAKGHHGSILISHQAIVGYLYDEACEARYEDLPVNFDYLAFGHVHDWALRSDRSPVFSYAGSTEIKSTREIPAFVKNGKSVNLVSMDKGSVGVERKKLSSVRFQYAIESRADSYVSDIEKTISKFSPLFGDKKPLFSLKIYGDVDKSKVKAELLRFDEVIFRPPEFVKEKVEVESRPGMENISDYLEAYFKDSPEMGEIAKEFYRHAKNDRTDAIQWLNSRLGADEK